MKAWSIIAALGFVFLSAANSSAEIYRYVDQWGNVHFTNTPMSHNWQEVKKKQAAPSPKVSDHRGRYDHYIKIAAATNGVSPALLKAVIRQESDFDHLAVSSAGACGLMQLMPQTAKLLNVKNVFDPYENIMGGAAYLRSLLDMFGGKIRWALGGYNAGPRNVLKHGGVPPIEETVDFVDKVMRYFNNYHDEMTL